MQPLITVISSMATRLLLAELAAAYTQATGHSVVIEAVGGLDAAKRVAAGEAFDVVVLASEPLDKLIAAGHVRAEGRVDLARSLVAVAVRAGAPQPDIGSEAALRRAVLDAGSVCFSSGPSGDFVRQLLQRWGIAESFAGRLVQTPPGVPVGSLVARGEVELGFQQLGELLPLPGITVLGTLPEPVACVTTFSAGLCTAGPHPDAVQALLRYFTSPAADAAKRRQGMTPV
jgi:molybdate transport system substrate-binding protein